MRTLRFSLALLFVLAWPAAAREFHLDPARGGPGGDGSAERPWGSLAEVVRAGQVRTRHWQALPYAPGATLGEVNAGGAIGPGDTLWLYDGDHGEVLIEGAYNAAPITVAAAPGQQPRLRRLRLRAGSHWRFVDLTFLAAPDARPEGGALLHVETHGHHGPSHDVEITGCRLRSAPDATGWAATDWVRRSLDGIVLDGTDHVVQGNRLEIVRHGISANGPRALVDGNTVAHFSGDGLRGLGDDSTFQYNLIMTNYAVDENHDDGFQSWSRGPEGVGTGVVRGVTLRGNVIIDHTDPAQPLRGPLQGIGCFDGLFEGWRVENNVLLVDHAHAITFAGARDTVIVNNTMHDPWPTEPGPAWIQIRAHRNDTPSAGVRVRNNLVDRLALAGGVEADHNLVVDDPAAVYVDPTGGDLSLRPGAPAIDRGSAELAPRIDQRGVARPQGAGVDIGAFEYAEPMEADAGLPEPDAHVPEPDAGLPQPDAHVPDAGLPDAHLPDAAPAPTDQGVADAAGLYDAAPRPDHGLDDVKPPRSPEAEPTEADSGCSASGSAPGALWWFLALWAVARVRRSGGEQAE